MKIIEIDLKSDGAKAQFCFFRAHELGEEDAKLEDEWVLCAKDALEAVARKDDARNAKRLFPRSFLPNSNKKLGLYAPLADFLGYLHTPPKTEAEPSLSYVAARILSALLERPAPAVTLNNAGNIFKHLFSKSGDDWQAALRAAVKPLDDEQRRFLKSIIVDRPNNKSFAELSEQQQLKHINNVYRFMCTEFCLPNSLLSALARLNGQSPATPIPAAFDKAKANHPRMGMQPLPERLKEKVDPNIINGMTGLFLRHLDVFFGVAQALNKHFDDKLLHRLIQLLAPNIQAEASKVCLTTKRVFNLPARSIKVRRLLTAPLSEALGIEFELPLKKHEAHAKQIALKWPFYSTRAASLNVKFPDVIITAMLELSC